MTETLARSSWSLGVQATGVKDQWTERGPLRAVLKRTFQFKDPAHKYEITFDFRAGDPWIDITDEYALGAKSSIRIDLSAVMADVVYHPHTYNARTFKPDGKEEDTTTEPPQHPIATLGPVWRDIWYGGGPFAFVYNSQSDRGVGLATVRGSQWRTPEGVSLVSQNLEVHGDSQQPGKVWVHVPTDGGMRRWALVLGPPDVRKRMGTLVRARADIPLQTVLKEWVLDWKSDAQEAKTGVGPWFGYFNRHFLNPTTAPRGLRKEISNLLAKGQPVKGKGLAALAYVFTNPDYWPPPEMKWGNVGNPNFHTDMYNIPLQIALLMPDHPHAKKWLDYGVGELKGNVLRDSFPGGAWAESLSYSQFFFHVVEYARKVRDAKVIDLFKEVPRIKEVATYLALMHTPVDPRYGCRQKAPIGDTHPGHYIDELRAMADAYKGVDDLFAQRLARLPEKWDKALDISSREFFGFGAMLRGNPYDERNESFVTVKAGPARNHFQGDELSFYFCSLGTPLAIDYACHYSPRPWHAAMHNRPDMDNLRPVAIAARRAFAASDAADVFVADERTTTINGVPLEPHNTIKPGWEYPTTQLSADKPWTMRRYAMLVKHDPGKSKLADYLVIRDEITSPQPVWWNLHMLARDITGGKEVLCFPGQLDVDVDAHFLTPKLGDIEKRQWGWSNESKENRGSLKGLKGAEYEKEHFGKYIPRDFQRGTWGKTPGQSGEMGKWLRVKGSAGTTTWLVVLMPRLQGQPAPKVEKLTDTSARITLGQESETVHLGTEGKHQAAVDRGGAETVLLKAGQVKGLNEVEFKPIPPGVDRGGL
jgi:hypothetical protein